MKLVHLSDLHLGKKLKGYSLIEDQSYILEQILSKIKAQKADAVIIAGDIYDKSVAPSEAVELFSKFLTALSNMNIPVFIISGNHDSGEKLSFLSEILEKEHIYIAGTFQGQLKKITLNDEFGPINFYLFPFVNASNIRQFFKDCKTDSFNDVFSAVIENTQIDENQRNIIAVHQFVTGATRCDSEEVLNVGTLDNISKDNFKKFDYCALGHIHSPQNIEKNKIRYCGSPLKYSLSEANQKKVLTVVNFGNKGETYVEEIELKPKRDLRIIKGTYNELMSKDFYENIKTEDYIHCILTDENYIQFAVERLKKRYDNLLSIEYENIKARTASKITNAGEIKAKLDSPMEIIEEFYKFQNGSESKLNEKQEKYLRGLIEKIWKEDDDI